jgi:V/A-type H+-transporting ATPase subunit I
MKKVSLVVQEKYRDEALKKLRELGVVHLERKTVSSDALTKLLERKTKVELAQGIVRPYQVAKKQVNGNARNTGAPPKRRTSDLGNPETEFYSADAVNAPERPDLIDLITNLGEERKNLQDQMIFLNKERSRVEVWGDFKSADIKELADKGVKLFLYVFPEKEFALLPQETKLIVVNRDKDNVYAVVFGEEVSGKAALALPEHSLSEINDLEVNIRDRLADIERQLENLTGRKPYIEAEQRKVLKQIEFETARAGMDVLDAETGTVTIAWLSGFVPDDDVGILKRAAAENHWALLADEPGEDDLVPTKLKNNRLASLINPLTDFLEVVPGYNEIDISGFFLFFFVLFFGMIFGDAGYGALILFAGIAGIIKTARKGVPPILKLLTLLGLSNFIWGVLTCSWFGISLEYLPAALKNISLPLISNVTSGESEYGKKIVQQNLMIFCFSLALLQLSIGHILAIFHNKSLKVLGDLGNIAMLGGMYFIILSLIASNEARQIPLFPQAIYVFAAGFVLNFVFGNYDGSVGKSIVESLKNIISVILGIANVFSDIMSYIRLWAVGLAGAAIADTVDKMAGPMLGHFVFFVFGVLLLVFGHGLNIVLNMLSVLVHGVRLNTLEFSGHVGLTWAGTAYKPFSETDKK